MDLGNFRKAKEKGAGLTLVGGKNFVITMPRFDPATGEEIEPELQVISRKQVAAMREDLQKKLDELTAVEAEMDSLEKK